MKILHVIHGFPPFYMAGSEVYTYNLTRELAKRDDVFVFTRIENPFEPAYTFYDETIDGVHIRRINKPQRDYTLEDKYLDEKMEDCFFKYIQKVKPDIVHFGHLSHLSTNLVNIAKENLGLPIVYTIHDFWLLCYRGQLVDTSLKICSGPSDNSCYSCASKIFKKAVSKEDIIRYRQHIARVINNIDLFFCPSLFLKKIFENNGVPTEKIRLSRYGFPANDIRYKQKKFTDTSKIHFGFIGRLIPVKGIKLLLEAFSKLGNTNSKLLIFGESGEYIKYLEKYANQNVVFMGGFKNWEIGKVLDQIDVLVVPSIWYENSPLVIQEAFLAGIPVITSDIGGMKELVEDGRDGFTFKMGDIESLHSLMKRIVTNPVILNNLHPNPKKVRQIEDDARGVRIAYEEVLKG